jgi:RNA polymerase sigma factor (sigma-70 family)
MEAFEKYDPNQKAKFSSYAAYWIKARMSMLCREFNMIQRSNQGKIGSKATKFQEQFYAKNMREATASEIVDHLSTNCNIDIKNYDDVLNITITSINTSYDDEKTTEECGEFAMKTSSNNGYIDKIESEELSDSITKMMRVLSEKEKDFVTRHICNGETYADIAEEAGYTIERVRQIIVGGLKKMRDCEYAKTHFACFLK